MMEDRIKKLLEDIQSGRMSAEDGMEKLRYLPFINLGEMKMDSHRSLRTGIPEAIFAPGKSKEQIMKIVEEMRGRDIIFVTKADESIYEALKNRDHARYYNKCGLVVIGKSDEKGSGYVAVVTAGTGDIPAAEEAAATAEALGSRVERIYDVGAAGLHRLLESKELLYNARAIVATAGMDGVLPGIIASLFPVPVVALPTSVGYGTGIDGFASMLTMLNSCSPGMAVVNIDNGFGAGVFAHKIIMSAKPE